MIRRKMRLIAVAGLVVILTFVLAGGAVAAKPEAASGLAGGLSEEYVADEILVKFKPGVGPDAQDAIHRAQGARVKGKIHQIGVLVLRIPAGQVLEKVAAYQKNPNVEYAEPNFIAYAHWEPNDEHYYYQWHMDDTKKWTGTIGDQDRELVDGTNPYGGENGGGINVEPAWDISTGTGVIVAVVDSGVAYEDHQEAIPIGRSGKYRYVTYALAPDLAGTSFVVGYDFVNNDAHPNDDGGHGTHVTGTIAQSTDNSLGVAGVAFDCSIMPVKVLDAAGSGTYEDVASGIYYAVDKGADIINMSLGGTAESITLENAVAYAYNNGVTVIASAGNRGPGGAPSYPAAYDAYVIAVGATKYDEAVAYYSTTGSYVDLTAPGGQLYIEGTTTMLDQNNDGYWDGVLQQTHDGSDYTNFGYWFYEGTSMAAPHVSGVAALLTSKGVATTPDEVREAVQSTAEDKTGADWTPEYGWGIVDAYAALNYTLVPNNQPVADANGPYSGMEDVAVTFDGSGSDDPDGDSLMYAWDFGDGSTGTGLNPTHVYTAGGLYNVTLVVNDGKVDSDPSTTSADITEVNDPPVADAGPDPTVIVDKVVTFDGSGSYDIDGTINAYNWDFGDGNTGTGVTTTHAYVTAGTYTVTLTVTDNGGLTDTDEAIVTVTETPAYLTMHVASIDMSTETRTAGRNTFTTAVATVKIIDAVGNPVEGATVSGHWSGLTSDIDSGLTDATGVVILKSDQIKNGGGTFTFTIDDVVLSGWIYDSSANGDFNGDGIAGDISNSITI